MILRDGYWLFTEGEVNQTIIFFFSVFIIIPIIISILMWRFPMAIAYRIVPEVKTKDKLGNLSIDQFQAAALSVAGILLIVWCLIDFMYWYVYFREISEYPVRRSLSPGGYASLMADFTKLGLGIWLAFGNRGIVNIINKLRYMGTKYYPSDEDSNRS